MKGRGLQQSTGDYPGWWWRKMLSPVVYTKNRTFYIMGQIGRDLDRRVSRWRAEDVAKYGRLSLVVVEKNAKSGGVY
jgi:hypothetical protein